MKKLNTTILFLTLVVCCSAQNGKLLSKDQVDLTKLPFWKKITVNDTLKDEYKFIDKINLYEIVYQSDSFEVKGFLCEPKKVGNYPVVIFNRGGNRDQGALSAISIIGLTSELASEGYVILASQYRGTLGTQGSDEFGGDDLHDVLNLIETAKEIENADESRIGIFGWSRGGMMTYMALRESDVFKTAVIGNGPSDLFKSCTERPAMELNVYSECIPGYWKNREVELKKRSAIFWADELPKSTSIMILCGSNDQMVHPDHGRNMAAKLKDLEHQCVLHELETNHKFSGKQAELTDLLIDWFNKELR